MNFHHLDPVGTEPVKISTMELLRLQQTEVQGTLFVCGMQEIVDLIIDPQRGLFEDLLGSHARA